MCACKMSTHEANVYMDELKLVLNIPIHSLTDVYAIVPKSSDHILQPTEL